MLRRGLLASAIVGFVLVFCSVIGVLVLPTSVRVATAALMALGCLVLFIFVRQSRRNERRAEALEQILAARDRALASTNDSRVRRRAEAEKLAAKLLESEALSRNVMDSLFVSVGVLNLDGTIIRANAAPLREAGIELEQVAGRPFWDAPWLRHSVGEQTRVKECIAAAALGERVRRDITFCRGGGTIITMDSMFGPLYDTQGKVYGVVVSGADISDRVQAQKALEYVATSGAVGEQFFEKLVQALADALGTRFAMASEFVTVDGMDRALVLGFSRDGEISRFDDYFLAGTPCAIVKKEGFHAVESGVAARYPMDVRLQEVEAESFLGVALRDVDGTTIGQICVFDTGPLSAERVKASVNAFASRAAAELVRLRSERTLRASEERFRLVIAATHDCVWDWDLLSHKAFLSPRWKEILGCGDDELPKTDAQVSDLIHPEDRQFALESMAEHILHQRPYDIEIRMRCKDGSYRWIHSRGQAVAGPDGVPFRMLGAATDITEAKHLEEALRESEDRFREFIEGTSDIVVQVDGTGHITYANGVAERLMGASPNDLIGRNALKSVHPDDIESVIAASQSWAKDKLERVSSENRIVTAKGDTRIILWSRSLRYEADGPLDHINSIGKDVTELRTAQKHIRILAETIKRAQEPVIICDLSGVIFEWNLGAERVFGYSRDEAIGKLVSMLHLDENVEMLKRNIREVLPKRGTWQIEIRMKKRSGELFDAHLSLSIVRDAAGKPESIIGIALDVSDRKRAEIALKEHEGRLDLIFNSVSDLQALLRVEEDGRLIFETVNRAFLNYIQNRIQISATEFVGLDWHEYATRVGVTPRQLEWEAPKYKAAIEGAEPVRYNIEIQTPGGIIVHEASLEAVRDENGKCTHLLWSTRDISERMRQEALLRHERDFSRSLLEAAPALVLVLTPEGMIDLVNPALERLTGYQLDEIRGKDSISTFIAERHRSQSRAAFREAIQGTPTVGSLVTIITREGEEREIEWYDQVLRDEAGHVSRLVIIGLDATERIRTQEKLIQSERRLTEAQRIAKVGNWDWNIVTNALWWSDEIYRIFGRTPREFVPTYHSYAAHIHPDDRSRIFEAIRRALDRVEDYNVDRRIIVNGETRIVHEQGEVTFAQDGTPLRMHGTMQDVSDSRMAQQELERYREHLEELVEERTARIQRLDSELLEASRRAGMAEIATGVLHNVGNVLNSVNVSAEVVSDSLAHLRTEEIVRAVKMLEAHKQDLAVFVTQDPKGSKVLPFLKLATSEIGQQKLDAARELESLMGHVDHIKRIVAMQQTYARAPGVPEDVSVIKLLREAEAMMRASKTSNGVAMAVECGGDLILTIEKHKVLQILVNLFHNACDSVLTAPSDNPNIRVHVQRPSEDRIGIVVEDNGIGIDPENLSRIFSLGFTTKESGHGFGLHMSAVAAEELGGSLSVHSAGAGRGARFTLELPTHARRGVGSHAID